MVARDTKTKKPISEDLKDLPPGAGAAIQRRRDLEALVPEAIYHYVYRYEGETSSTPKHLVARLDGDKETFETPDDHEIGMKFGRAGLFSITTKIKYRDSEGKLQEKLEPNPVFRVGPEYERVKEVAPPSASAAPAPGGTLEALSALDKVADIVVKLRGDAPAATPADAVALQAALDQVRKDSDARITRLTKEFEEREARLIKEAKAAPAAEAAPITPRTVEDWAGTAGTVARVGKEILDAFKTNAPGGEA